MTITLPEELEKQLEAAARSRGLPIDAYARSVLADALGEAARRDRAALLVEADKIRAMTPPGPKTDSGDVLSTVRDERYGH